jgi:ATP-dependent DNA helicase RecG
MEGQNLDWKEKWNDDFLNSICAFANTDGGGLLIGKRDSDGAIVGVDNPAKLVSDLPKKIISSMAIIADVVRETIEGKDCVRIIVNPYPNAISCKGNYYIRSGSNTIKLTGHALDEFLLRKQGRSWDGIVIPDVTVEDLDIVAFRDFRKMAVRSKRLTEKDVDITDAELVDNLNLSTKDGLKRAAILLFHENPEKWVFGANVKIGYFETDSELLYQDEVTGSIISMADKVIDLLYSKYFKGFIRYEGIQRIDDFPIPKEAMREAVLNAIVHRDYSTNVAIQIKVFPDRVIIWNDGTPPADFSLEKLLSTHSSAPHNPMIANAFFRSGQIEAWGRGIDKIRSECRKEGKYEPKFLIGEKIFEVEFRYVQPENGQRTR